jgi:hypothetical protein
MTVQFESANPPASDAALERLRTGLGFECRDPRAVLLVTLD